MILFILNFTYFALGSTFSVINNLIKLFPWVVTYDQNKFSNFFHQINLFQII